MTSLFADPEFYVLVSFVIFFVLFGGKIWAALTGLLDARTEAVRAELAEAQKLRQEAETMLADAVKARQEALAQAATVLERSKIEAAQLVQQAAHDAAAAAKRREKEALERIAAAEKAAIDDVRKTAADIATEAATRAISTGLAPEAASTILDAAIADLPRALRAA